MAEPAVVLHAPSDSIANEPTASGADGVDRRHRQRRRPFEGFNRSAHQVARYAASSPAVAQVLANTPTYMIFDDHEVADDWNLNGRWVTRVYGREWGRFIVRNGLLAFTLMQAWGNDPAHFAKDEPGRKLLDAIPAAVAPGTPPTPATTADLDVLLGFDAPTHRPAEAGPLQLHASRRRTTASSCSTRARTATSAT